MAAMKSVAVASVGLPVLQKLRDLWGRNQLFFENQNLGETRRPY